MKTLHSSRDLTQFGVNPLTGEACAFSLRVLCDLSEKGRTLVATFLGSPHMDCFALNWNSTVGDELAVSSVMLTRATLSDLCIFALLLHHHVVLEKGGTYTALDKEDDYYTRYMELATRPDSGYTVYRNPRPAPGADRNEHAFTGRTE